MKGARQSSSLPEVGKRRRGEEERAAARKKRGRGQGGLGEGRHRAGAPRVCSALLPALHPFLERL